jgi:hypothetical protein
LRQPRRAFVPVPYQQSRRLNLAHSTLLDLALSDSAYAPHPKSRLTTVPSSATLRWLGGLEPLLGVNLQVLRRTGHANPYVVEDWHQVPSESLELLVRAPYLADA